MKTGNKERLETIVRVGEQLASFLKSHDITAEEIISDCILQWTITTPLYNIGEQVNSLDRDFCESYPDVPWFMIAGMRHRLVHDYEGTNWSIVAHTVLEDVPAFVARAREILDSL